MPAKSKSDVDTIVAEILSYERANEEPPDISATEGWSPYLAREFLAEVDLRTSDYHSGFDGDDWWAAVVSTDLDDSILPATANYSFEGERGVVKTLRLRGHFMDEFLTEKSKVKFSEIALLLCSKAVPEDMKILNEPVVKLVDFDIHLNTASAKLQLKRFPNEKGYNLVFELTRGLDANSEPSTNT